MGLPSDNQHPLWAPDSSWVFETTNSTTCVHLTHRRFSKRQPVPLVGARHRGSSKRQTGTLCGHRTLVDLRNVKRCHSWAPDPRGSLKRKKILLSGIGLPRGCSKKQTVPLVGTGPLVCLRNVKRYPTWQRGSSKRQTAPFVGTGPLEGAWKRQTVPLVAPGVF